MKMKNLIQAAVGTLFAASAAQAQQAVQWRVEDGGNGHWFGLGAPAANWHAAAADAASKGGHLATLRSTGETAFAASVAGGENVAYIGAVQAPGSAEPFTGWQWITGEPWGYESWHFNMDDAPCGSSAGDGEQQFLWMHNAVGQWDDVNDQDLPGCPLESKRGIVEWSADCNGDGIVDYGQCRNGSLPDYNGNNIPDCCDEGVPCLPGRYPLQWRAEDGGNGHWYQASANLGLTFLNARNQATGVGGDLVTPQSPAELDFVFRNLASDPAMWWYVNGIPRHGPWIGLRQDRSRPDYSEPAGGWAWIDGTYATFQNWDLDTCQTQPTDCFCGGGCGLDNAGFYEGDPASGNTVPTWAAFAADMSGRVGGVIIEWSADCNSDGVVDYGQILQGQLVDANTNGIPDICEGPTCRDADLFRDFNVNGADLGILLSQWGPNTALTVSDINEDGFVNGADLGILLSFWGACP
jgi:hypothetical protein